MIARMATTARELLSLSRSQLDELYRSSRPGAIPAGEGRGTALVFPGTPVAPFAAAVARLVAWQGTIFDPRQGESLNRMTLFRIMALRAKTYKGPSRLDGRESIILDHCRTSLAARWVHDEMREVSPGVYLGLTYLSSVKAARFALEFLRSGPDGIV